MTVCEQCGCLVHIFMVNNNGEAINWLFTHLTTLRLSRETAPDSVVSSRWVAKVLINNQLHACISHVSHLWISKDWEKIEEEKTCSGQCLFIRGSSVSVSNECDVSAREEGIVPVQVWEFEELVFLKQSAADATSNLSNNHQWKPRRGSLAVSTVLRSTDQV